MHQQSTVTAEVLESAKQLIMEIESGNTEAVGQILENMSALRERHLFKELGKLTRDLHNAITGFQADTRITTMTEKEIPDARERLNYVISMTEQAANRSLNAVENAIPLSENLKKRADYLKIEWDRFKNNSMSVDEFCYLSKDIDDFFELVQTEVTKIHDSLSEVLMAQDFQDITGQVIKQVIGLVNEVENNLVNLIRLSGSGLGVTEQKNSAEKPIMKPSNGASSGLAVPGIDVADVVSGQDEVDGLLSSLGF